MTIRNLLHGLWLSAGIAALTLPVHAASPVKESAASAKSGYDAVAWAADYAQMKSILEHTYANLAWFGSPEGGLDLPQLDRQTRADLAMARSDAEARRVLESFATAFNGGHFQVVGDAVPSTAPAPALGPKPFDVSDPAGTCAGLGFNPIYDMAFSLPFETLPDFTLTDDGMSSVYRAGFTKINGITIGLIRLQKFAMRGFPAACTQAWAKMVTDKKPVTERPLRDAAELTLYSALSDEITKLRKAGATVLIVDVGNNTGGNDSAELYARLLTDKPVRSPRLLVTANAAGAAYFDQQIGGIDEVLNEHPSADAQAALAEARSFFVKAKAQTAIPCDLSWVWREQRPWAGSSCKGMVDAGYAGGYAATLPRGAFNGNQDVSGQLSYASNGDDIWAMWTGPLYVVTDSKTYSSAEMFAADVQDNAIGKTVGATTGGDGCGFMGGNQAVALNHSHLRLRIPNCIRLRRDGNNEIRGIVPNLAVLPTEGEDDRQRAIRLLTTVANDAKH
jgi:hypothetical protein